MFRLLAASRQRLARLGRPFGLLLASDVLMILAMLVSQVTMPWWIVRHGGAPHLVLYVAILSAVSFIALPLLSPLGDRISKRVLITTGLAAMAVQGLVLGSLAYAGIYSIGWIIGLSVIEVVAAAAIMPVSLSIAAELLPPHQLSEGLGYQKSAQALGRLLGPVVGGTVLATGSIAAALWLNAALLLLACTQAARVVVPHLGGAAHSAAHSAAQWLADLHAGLRAKWLIPMERGWTLVSFLVMIFFVPGIGMLVPLKVQSLGLSGAWLGACEAGLSLGMLLGSLGGSVWLAERVGRFRASVGAILGEGVALAVVGYTHQPWLMVLALFGVGLCIATVQLVGHTHRTLATPQAFRARMAAVNMMVMQVTAIIGPGLVGVGLVAWHVDQVYLAVGAGLFLVGLGYTQVPGYRHFLSLPHAEAAGFYAREYPALFAEREPPGAGRS